MKYITFILLSFGVLSCKEKGLNSNANQGSNSGSESVQYTSGNSPSIEDKERFEEKYKKMGIWLENDIWQVTNVSDLFFARRPSETHGAFEGFIVEDATGAFIRVDSGLPMQVGKPKVTFSKMPLTDADTLNGITEILQWKIISTTIRLSNGNGKWTPWINLNNGESFSHEFKLVKTKNIQTWYQTRSIAIHGGGFSVELDGNYLDISKDKDAEK